MFRMGKILYFSLEHHYALWAQKEKNLSQPVAVLHQGQVWDMSLELSPGLRRGMGEREARQAYPEAAWVPLASLYGQPYREKVMEAAYRFSPQLEPEGDGAAYLALGAGEEPAAMALSLGRLLVPSLAPRVRMGVGPNLWVAHLAAQEAKEELEGNILYRRVPAEEKASFLAPLPVRVLEKVAEGVAGRLERVGLATLGEVAAVPLGELRQLLGKEALAVYGYSRGEDGRPLRPGWPIPMVIRFIRLDPPLEHLEKVPPLLDRLAREAARELEGKGQGGREASLLVESAGSLYYARRTASRLFHGEALAPLLHRLWVGEIWPSLAREGKGWSIARLQVEVGPLQARGRSQASLWTREKGKDAGAVWMSLREKYPHLRWGTQAAPREWREERLSYWDPFRFS
ncbi:MAG: hypothetical protein QJR00_07845 [Bacillota bacterium]|nr:hypothetical protein [Bacillota bacterium]